jgi:asparagine synthase (glutamine-hydrolysing)
MCGLAGEITFDGTMADPAAVARMTETLAPRGPDGSGLLMRGRVGTGHRRLKIIDISEKAEQPMVDAELGLSLVFNGCIYNYKDLRAELEAKGYRFFSSGDTEVVVKAWHAWGTDCVDRFNGMFALAIHERDSGRLILARDRFGIKPLYLAESHGKLRFASSLPALLAAGGIDTSIDRVALQQYMTFHSIVPPPRTILNGVRKLPPATIRIVEPDGRTKERRYWNASYDRSAEAVTRPADEWREEVTAALKQAVARRMVADVPVGVLLSGGLDSSLIVGLLAEAGQKDLMTFSIGFESVNGETGDEFVYSDVIAKRFKTRHHKIFVGSDRLIEALPSTIAAMSEPMVSYDNVGFHLLSREVAKHVKVVQSGQGADEVFGGYHWYPPLTDSNDVVGDYANVFFDRSHEKLAEHLNPDWMIDEDACRDFVAAHFEQEGAATPVDKALRIDSEIMLVDDPVKRVDNMTMAAGIEARVPFLDHELVGLAATVPPELKLADGGKGILKDIGRRIIPSEVIDRKKGYFPVPALKYVEGPVLEMVEGALGAKPARDRGIFRDSYLKALFADPKKHITPLRGSELWQAALLEMWLQTNGI